MITEEQAAAQMQRMADEWRGALEKQMGELRLRQWCIEQATKSLTLEGSHPALLMTDGQPSGATNVQFCVVALANDILKFIAAPFGEVFK